jgi:hypothetical protein
MMGFGGYRYKYTDARSMMAHKQLDNILESLHSARDMSGEKASYVMDKLGQYKDDASTMAKTAGAAYAGLSMKDRVAHSVRSITDRFMGHEEVHEPTLSERISSSASHLKDRFMPGTQQHDTTMLEKAELRLLDLLHGGR